MGSSFNSNTEMKTFMKNCSNISEKNFELDNMEEYSIKITQEIYKALNHTHLSIINLEILQQLLYNILMLENYHKEKQEELMSKVVENNAQLEIVVHLQNIIKFKIKTYS